MHAIMFLFYISFHFFLMSCSSGCSNAACPCKFAPWLPRVAFGLILVAYGVNHYRHIGDFVGMAKSAYPTVSMIASVAGLLAYIVPALMIVGGALFAVKQLCCVAKTCILASLAGIIGWASVAVLVGDGSMSGAMMPMIQNAAILLLLFFSVKKLGCCSSGACAPTSK